ncbi:hypothetical protein ACFX2J_019439 [Malus domestica]
MEVKVDRKHKKKGGIARQIGKSQQNEEVIGSEATRVIHREMPVELLHASLPHIDEHKRKLLSDFAHRSMPISGLNAHGGSGGRMNSESMRG